MRPLRHLSSLIHVAFHCKKATPRPDPGGAFVFTITSLLSAKCREAAGASVPGSESAVREAYSRPNAAAEKWKIKVGGRGPCGAPSARSGGCAIRWKMRGCRNHPFPAREPCDSESQTSAITGKNPTRSVLTSPISSPWACDRWRCAVRPATSDGGPLSCLLTACRASSAASLSRAHTVASKRASARQELRGRRFSPDHSFHRRPPSIAIEPRPISDVAQLHSASASTMSLDRIALSVTDPHCDQSQKRGALQR